MKVSLNLDQHYCTVEREPHERRCPTESAFYYRLKKVLIAQGHDVIKRLMWRDGHLVDSKQYYIRMRNWDWCVWDGAYALRNPAEQFNQGLCIHLGVQMAEEGTVK